MVTTVKKGGWPWDNGLGGALALRPHLARHYQLSCLSLQPQVSQEKQQSQSIYPTLTPKGAQALPFSYLINMPMA